MVSLLLYPFYRTNAGAVIIRIASQACGVAFGVLVFSNLGLFVACEMR